MTIDSKKIPNRIAVDTSVLIAAKKADDPNHQVCRDFWNAALNKGVEILIPAISYGEFTKSSPEHIPRVQGLEVVAFDQRAAELAQQLPPEAWKKHGSRQVAKVDALIAACAKRHLATHLFTVDGNQAAIARAIGLVALHPSDLLEAQHTLGL